MASDDEDKMLELEPGSLNNPWEGAGLDSIPHRRHCSGKSK